MFDSSVVRALIEAGHARGLLVVAHIDTLDDVRTVVNGGVGGVAHIWRFEGAAPDVAKLIADRHVFVIPTLVVPDGFIPGTGAAFAADPRLRPFLSAELLRHMDGSERSPSSPVLQNVDLQIAAVRSLVAAGARLLAGTDPPNATLVHGVSLHRELELLVRSGLTPTQALTAATKSTADVFHLDDRGRHRSRQARRSVAGARESDARRDGDARHPSRVAGVEFPRATSAR